ncbi:MAG TPA: UDP-N-acetylmuramoyl-L-alanine--D-glutamate ligase [Acidobacteriota bacterium]|nr:UDP-N-acetylmuramoyl-L-alanine--D-glutamate ligase [Acidobacteriota bacterium]|tara:strand:- start:1828 stop:3264 length:1437 start_codon:yes stop_codon:yes gene_type:complete
MNVSAHNASNSKAAWQNRSVVVVGAGVSGVAAAQLLLDCGAEVTLTDTRPESEMPNLIELTERGVRLVAGGHPSTLWPSVDSAVFSPGIRPDAPVTIEAREAGVTVLPEIEVAADLTEVPIIAITGSNGKSTVTSMVGAILEQAGLDAPVCGNLGTALSEVVLAELNGETSPDAYVVEVSSFQAHSIRNFHPRFAVILNIQPDHLDWHGTLDAYTKAKLRLVRNMGAADWLVYNSDDPKLTSYRPQNNVRLLPFMSEPSSPEAPAAWVSNGKICWWTTDREAAAMDVEELRVIGQHNQTNACVAAAVASLLNVAPGSIRAALSAYEGLAHRMEYCGEVGGVRCINDSKATNIDASLAALSGFDRGVRLILGGRDKGADFGELLPVLGERVASVLLIGEASSVIEAALSHHRKLQRCETMECAVARALDEGNRGDTLLLSPACTSFDQYPNFEERGRHFKSLVAAHMLEDDPSQNLTEI